MASLRELEATKQITQDPHYTKNHFLCLTMGRMTVVRI